MYVIQRKVCHLICRKPFHAKIGMLSVACWSAWIINFSFRAYFSLNWNLICIIVKHLGHIFDFLRQIWSGQRLRARHARMLHASELNTFVYVTYQNTGNFMCWFHFRGQNYVFWKYSPTLADLRRFVRACAVLETRELKVKWLFWPWKWAQRPQLPTKDISLVKNVPGWPSWLWAHAR